MTDGDEAPGDLFITQPRTARRELNRFTVTHGAQVFSLDRSAEVTRFYCNTWCASVRQRQSVEWGGKRTLIL